MYAYCIQAGDRGEVEQSSDIAQSLEQPIQKKGRARLSSSGSNGSGGTRKTGRTRRGSADSITKSCTKKRRKVWLACNEQFHCVTYVLVEQIYNLMCV